MRWSVSEAGIDRSVVVWRPRPDTIAGDAIAIAGPDRAFGMLERQNQGAVRKKVQAPEAMQIAHGLDARCPLGQPAGCRDV